MSKLMKVEGHGDLRRDPKSNAIVSLVDTSNHLKKRDKQKQTERRLDEMEQKLTNIEQSISKLIKIAEKHHASN